MQKHLTLERFAKTSHGVLGRLGPFRTLERQDLGNKPNVSCIPAGTYTCRRSFFNRGGYPTFEVTGVPGRSLILFHVGNTEGDSNGCILIGREFGVLNVTDPATKATAPKIATLTSKDAFAAFMKSLEGVESFTLTIREV